MRTLIFELGRDPVEDGLVVALGRYASRLGAREGLRIDVKAPEGRLQLPPGTERQLFGIAREALANVVKHSGADTVWLRIEARSREILVEIRDDGRGFDAAAPHPGHFGLDSMRSRATEVGGLLTIVSARGRGTVVRVEVPAEKETILDGA
jgi:signal transduction histidine kinase